ncbi:hypothetical protein J3F83DRAFT_141965 [Trichoderma novae-zelandiae]
MILGTAPWHGNFCLSAPLAVLTLQWLQASAQENVERQDSTEQSLAWSGLALSLSLANGSYGYTSILRPPRLESVRYIVVVFSSSYYPGASLSIAPWTMTDRGPGPSHRHGLSVAWPTLGLRARGSIVSILPNAATERGIHALF